MINIMSYSLPEQLVEMAASVRRLARGRYLFHRADPVKFIYFIQTGLIELLRQTDEGRTIVLQRAGPNSVLAEASAYSDVYHCDAIAAAPTRVHVLSRPVFLRRLEQDSEFSRQWSSHLAGEIQSARYRSEILARNTVAERLNGWLAWHDNKLPPKGQWKEIAAQIGVSAEALYRELAKRRQR